VVGEREGDGGSRAVEGGGEAEEEVLGLVGVDGEVDGSAEGGESEVVDDDVFDPDAGVV